MNARSASPSEWEQTAHLHLLVQRGGVVTLFGCGITARLDRSHLTVEDWTSAGCRQTRFARVGMACGVWS
jgi:hypothetical protein